jgi:hypothetical protein
MRNLNPIGGEQRIKRLNKGVGVSETSIVLTRVNYSTK